MKTSLDSLKFAWFFPVKCWPSLGTTVDSAL